MAVEGSSSPSVLAKRDHEGDVEMSHFSPENVSLVHFSHHVTPGLTCVARKKHDTYDVQVFVVRHFMLDQDGKPDAACPIRI
jgi:hypothetical protein